MIPTVRPLVTLITTIGIVLVAVTALMLIFERQLIYFPFRPLSLAPADLALAHAGKRQPAGLGDLMGPDDVHEVS